MHLFVGRDVIEALAPQLAATTEAVDLRAERLVTCALALVAAEKKRRLRAPPPVAAHAARRRRTSHG